ncbi:ankyrin repeat protein [Catovirus CTV1]|uniref:Ankyrin repeat protein n=1 Tax=Catovirus CTV1 TaxID=1977631 RepID=A0A1V0S8Q7_9VIRU|nr:ankyrin repeat protein [Catovirus CTV1]
MNLEQHAITLSIPDIKQLVYRGNVDIYKVIKQSISAKKIEILKQLIEIDSNLQENTPKYLKTASKVGNLEIFEYLLKHLDDNNMHRPKNYNKFLMEACCHGHLSIVKYIAENKFLVHPNYLAAVETALHMNHMEIVKYLIDNNICTQIDYKKLLTKASENNNVNAIKYLTEKIMEINRDKTKKEININNECESALRISIEHNNSEITELFLKIGFNSYINSGPCRWTPLEYACSEGHLEIIKLLLSYGASKINAILHVRRGKTYEIYKCLISAGADINQLDSITRYYLIKEFFEKCEFDILIKIVDDIEDDNIKKVINRLKNNRNNFFANLKKINNVSIITF